MIRGGFRKSLSELIGEELASLTPRSFDVVGNIAIIKLPESLLPHKQAVAKALMSINRQIRTVLLQTSNVNGPFRLRKLGWIGGIRTWETVHKENGCVFKLDLRRVYFSPRLSYERMRVARQVRPGEVIVNMFAGVGCFSIVISKNSRAEKVYSIDINPEAWRYAKSNVLLNRVKDKIKVLLGDADRIVPSVLKGIAHRVVMPLPMLSDKSIPAAVEALRPEGGIIHYYTHLSADRSEVLVHSAWIKVRSLIGDSVSLIDLKEGRRVRSIGPRQYQVVLDIQVRR
ncbi:MAG: class I SAM-dependent methyltransferase family protein [Candidatus Bathyarchaeota archaeon]|nr:MAG: class I SAM-dependent methyltransferase family protein [Candidatus Bathyarchaeota archaeon]